MAKSSAMILLLEPISKNKSLYIKTHNKKDLFSIDKTIKLLDKSKNTKMLKIRHITLESEHTTFNQSKSRIQST